MIKIEEVFYTKEIMGLSHHPDLKSLFDKREKIKKSQIQGRKCVKYLIKENNRMIGFIYFKLNNKKRAVVSIAFLKKYRGIFALYICKKTREMFKKKRNHIIVAKINKENKSSLIFAKWFGFRIYEFANDIYYLHEYEEI